jgi:hypothetical protein
MREHDLGNLGRKFAYDGLNHHTLLATRHDGRVRCKSVGRKRGFGEGEDGGNGCSDEGTWCSKITFSRPPQAQSTRQRQPESGSFDSDFCRDGGQSACSFASIPRVPNGRIGRIQAFTSPNSSTAAAVTFITFVQDLKKKTKAWAPLIELCASGEKTLERFRYQFPDDWLYSDQLRGEWSAYNEILKRKNDSIQEQLGMYPMPFERCVVNQHAYCQPDSS